MPIAFGGEFRQDFERGFVYLHCDCVDVWFFANGTLVLLIAPMTVFTPEPKCQLIDRIRVRYWGQSCRGSER
jgi:hypothetical protein